MRGVREWWRERGERPNGRGEEREEEEGEEEGRRTGQRTVQGARRQMCNMGTAENIIKRYKVGFFPEVVEIVSEVA